MDDDDDDEDEEACKSRRARVRFGTVRKLGKASLTQKRERIGRSHACTGPYPHTGMEIFVEREREFVGEKKKLIKQN